MLPPYSTSAVSLLPVPVISRDEPASLPTTLSAVLVLSFTLTTAPPLITSPPPLLPDPTPSDPLVVKFSTPAVTSTSPLISFTDFMAPPPARVSIPVLFTVKLVSDRAQVIVIGTLPVD